MWQKGVQTYTFLYHSYTGGHVVCLRLCAPSSMRSHKKMHPLAAVSCGRYVRAIHSCTLSRCRTIITNADIPSGIFMSWAQALCSRSWAHTWAGPVLSYTPFNFLTRLSISIAVCGCLSGHRLANTCLLYTSPSPRDVEESRMPSSA